MTSQVLVDGADFTLRQLSERARLRGEFAVHVRLVEFANEAAAKKTDHAELGRRAYGLIVGKAFAAVIRTPAMSDADHASRIHLHNDAVWRELTRIAGGGMP